MIAVGPQACLESLFGLGEPAHDDKQVRQDKPDGGVGGIGVAGVPERPHGFRPASALVQGQTVIVEHTGVRAPDHQGPLQNILGLIVQAGLQQNRPKEVQNLAVLALLLKDLPIEIGRLPQRALLMKGARLGKPGIYGIRRHYRPACCNIGHCFMRMRLVRRT